MYKDGVRGWDLDVGCAAITEHELGVLSWTADEPVADEGEQPGSRWVQSNDTHQRTTLK